MERFEGFFGDSVEVRNVKTGQAGLVEVQVYGAQDDPSSLELEPATARKLAAALLRQAEYAEAEAPRPSGYQEPAVAL